MGRTTLKLPDPISAFRLPKALLTNVDVICAQEDLTRSQLYRRSVIEYLKRQKIDIVREATSAEPNSFFDCWQEGANEGRM
jgi:hypothetical protein